MNDYDEFTAWVNDFCWAGLQLLGWGMALIALVSIAWGLFPGAVGAIGAAALKLASYLVGAPSA